MAISTAASSGLNYIVVETINSAQACIELLRRRNREETVTCLILVTLFSAVPMSYSDLIFTS